MKENNNKVIVYLLIILIVLIGIFAFLLIDRKLQETKETNEIERIEPTTTRALVIQDIRGYLNYVPTLRVQFTPEVIKSCGYSEDAYSGNNKTIKNIDNKLILNTAFNNTYKEFVSDIECLGECDADSYCLKSELKKVLKEIYNIDNITFTNFKGTEGDIFVSEKYYALNDDSLEPESHKISKVIKFDIENNNLVVYEKAAFMVEFDENMGIYKTNKPDSLVTKLDYSGKYEEPAEKTALKYLENQIDKFYTFKHTFKPHENKEYYWYSTEVEK